MTTKRRKTNQTGRNETSRYVKLDHWALDSKAAKALSGHAFKLLVYVWKRHNGANNGQISFSVREAEDIGLVKSVAARAFAELISTGFLQVRRNSRFTLKTKEARTWEVTAEPCDQQPAKKTFMRWSPGAEMTPAKNKTRSPVRDRQSPHRDSDPENETKLPITVPPGGPSTPDSTSSQSLWGDTFIYQGGIASEDSTNASDHATAAGRDDTILSPELAPCTITFIDGTPIWISSDGRRWFHEPTAAELVASRTITFVAGEVPQDALPKTLWLAHCSPSGHLPGLRINGKSIDRCGTELVRDEWSSDFAMAMPSRWCAAVGNLDAASERLTSYQG